MTLKESTISEKEVAEAQKRELNIDSGLNSDEKRDLIAEQNRDASWKVLGNICEVVSIFQYSIVVFYCQMVLADQLYSNENAIIPLVTAKLMWLLMETIMFYTYMLSSCGFILFRQFMGTFYVLQQSDIKKLLTDFIQYAAINLTWFNLNFMLVVMPLVMLLLLQPSFGDKFEDSHVTESGIHFQWIVWAIWACHVV